MRPIDKPQGILGALWMIYGVICLAEAVWIAVNDAARTTMWATVVSRVAYPIVWMDSFRVFLVGMVKLAVGAGILTFLAGMALTRRTSPNRPLVLTASFLGILHGPLGIALGVYTLVLLVPRPPWRVRDRLPNAA